MNRLAPIILFVYNRPGHTRTCLEYLERNELASESELYIFADGARPGSEEAVAAVRQVIARPWKFRQVTVVERPENRGLAANVIDGVTTLLERYDRVIVLEDDLVVAPYFLRFMNDALELYRDEPRVGHIQACDFTGDRSLPDIFLIKFTGSWGWGTWRRAWRYFNPDGAVLLRAFEQDKRLCRTFDFNGKYRFIRMLRRQAEGKINSWAIRWNASLFLNDILSLNVGRSLVRNIGFDGSGTNCGGGHLYDSELYMAPLKVYKISPVVENVQARKAWERYYARTQSFWAKAWRRVKRTLKGDFGA
ncbi:MAG TPA: glycosyltransferase [Candidatus Barnesiella excrementavium]|nr:glycosyltransferase [Candidatus Barnesiella excrementavium]